MGLGKCISCDEVKTKIPPFFIAYSFFFIGGVSLYATTQHGDSVLWINQNRGAFLDVVMPYITILGDGYFFALMALLVLVWKRRMAIIFGIAGLIQALTSTFLKRVLFNGLPRPKKYFEGTEALSFIEGVKVASYFSFPSGHTMSAFLLAGLFSFFWTNNKVTQMILLLGASVVAISRIYLLQHFLRDVVAGSLLGILIAMLTWYVIQPKVNKLLPSK